MSGKHLGRCSFCEEKIKPVAVEKNFLRRDKCRCPECNEIIFECRNPFCHDYAKGGEYYDNELCRWCTENTGDAIKTGVGLIITGFIANKMTK
jgi:hypothetical protein